MTGEREDSYCQHITGVVLAGGLSRRMGQRDKAWMMFEGKPMIEHILARLKPQVGSIIISANKNLARYQALNEKIVPDVFENFCGPLAGWHAALMAAATPWLVFAPCDSPRMPTDLVARLYDALADKTLPCARPCVVVPSTKKGLHPVFALLHRDLLPSLTQYLESGERKAESWCRAQEMIEVSFDDESDAFCNINTEQDLRYFEQGEKHDYL